MTLRRAAAGRGVLLAAALTSGCSVFLSTGVPLSKDVQERASIVTLHGESLTLHLASTGPAKVGPDSPVAPLVVYSSGDGGWFGAAVGMFHTIASNAYPTAGFSAKEFMRIERKLAKPIASSQLIEDYHHIIDAARTELQLPAETAVVLTGWSRGAALGAIVGSKLEADSRIIGLVLIGLAAEEHLDIDGETDDDAAPVAVDAAAHAHAIALYPLLSKLASRRVVVLQATADGYLSAARARELFGADTTTRRLVAITARNHRFSGGEASFTAALIDAMRWIAAGDPYLSFK